MSLQLSLKRARVASAVSTYSDSADSLAQSESGARHYDRVEYWNERYKSQLNAVKKHNQNLNENKLTTGSNKKTKKNRNSTIRDSATETDEAESDVTDEWYYSVSDIEFLLLHHHRVSPSSFASYRVLDIGCGFSSLFRCLIESDLQWNLELLVGVDYSPAVISHLTSASRPLDSRIRYELMDFCVPNVFEGNSLFRLNSFDFIFDKATSDGLCCSEESASRTPAMYRNVAKLLAPGGIFIIASVSDVDSLWFTDYLIPSLTQASDQADADANADVDSAAAHSFLVTVHSTSSYYDGDSESPFLYVIQKSIKTTKYRKGKKQEIVTVITKQH